MRIGIGISGGVDSAVAASMLLGEGHEVIGYTMLLFDGQEETVERAASVANRLGIQHRVVDLRAPFEDEVLAYFTDEYRCGRTPSPCVRCNRRVKLGLFAEIMLHEGCDCVATGHYARIAFQNELPQLLRGKDASKDQSYFLAHHTHDQLARTRFPLGNLHKTDVKQLGISLGLVPASQSESQDLCFLPDGDVAAFLLRRHPELASKGWIVDGAGRQLGRHNGAFRYTVGQRRGLGLGGGPWFVMRTDLQTNTVTVGHEDELRLHGLLINQVNWLTTPPEIGGALRATFQMRSQMRPVPATLLRLGETTAGILFDPPIPPVPCGQLAVGYDQERVLLSGWIQETMS